MKPRDFIAVILSLFLTLEARAQATPSIPVFATQAELIVHAQAAPNGSLAVIETWKGAYSPDLFAPPPPRGFIAMPEKGVPKDGSVVLVYLSLSATAGRFEKPDLVIPVTNGKVAYPPATSANTPAKEYTLAAFKAGIQSAVKFPLVNGDFDASPVGTLPEGWKAAYPTGSAVVASDEKDTFLRLNSGNGDNAGVSQVLPVPPRTRSIAVLGRMRGKPKNEKDEKRAAVEVAIRFQDSKGGSIRAAVVASGSSPAWRTFRNEFSVPDGCTKVEVVARSIFAVGTFDFDTVRVEFR